MGSDKRSNRFFDMDGRAITITEARKQLGELCACCGSVEGLELDHIVPVSRAIQFGVEPELYNRVDNLQPLCHSCHKTKRTGLVCRLHQKRFSRCWPPRRCTLEDLQAASAHLEQVSDDAWWRYERMDLDRYDMELSWEDHEALKWAAAEAEIAEADALLAEAKAMAAHGAQMRREAVERRDDAKMWAHLARQEWKPAFYST